MSGTPSKKNDRSMMYAIIFLILLVIALITISFAVHAYNTLNSCNTQPEIQCYDDWYCYSGACPATSTGYNSCFYSPQYSDSGGLASCLFGPASPLATQCSLTSDSTSCACSIGSAEGGCLSNCTLSNGKATQCTASCPTAAKRTSTNSQGCPTSP